MAHPVDRRVTMYARDTLTVWAYRSTEGNLHIEGQDLESPPGEEYEYFLTVPEAQIPTLTTALGSPGADILNLLEEHGEHIVHTGERTWLRSLGVEPCFASWGVDERANPGRRAVEGNSRTNLREASMRTLVSAQRCARGAPGEILPSLGGTTRMCAPRCALNDFLPGQTHV